MKKLIYCVATFVATLFAASCAQENLQPVGGNIVSFKVEIPEVATKAEAVGNDAKMIDDLVYAVYRTTAGSVAEALENWNDKTTFLYAINSPAELKRFKDGTDIISIELLNDQNHIVLLWAQHNDTWVDEQGENIKLTEITYPSPLEVSAHVADKYAAFSAVKFIAANDKSNTEPIKLTRPFAQINLATVDPREYDVVINSTTLTVNAAGDNFNVASQLPAGSQDVTYSWAGKVYEDKLNANSQNYDHYLAMGYVFAAGNVSVDYTIVTAGHGTITNTITNVPVAKNYRTNIIGNLLTSDVDYNVTLDMNWGDEGENMEVLCEGVVKNINGDYEISTLEGLVYAINNLFVDANGVADAGTFYVKPGIYDMAQHVINDIVVTSGTLKVYGSETVVTRAVGSGNGVIISGLKKAIINGVAEGTTVFFSGITIEDFEGADDAAALVQNNSGKVVLAGCDIVDENGNPDEETELVGGNDPIEVAKGEEAATDLIYTAEQLAAAFADETVESIALGADIALENTLVFPAGRTATLDLRGWELSIAEADKVSTTYVINNHGTLTIKDSYVTGQVNARGIYNGYGNGGENVSNAKLTIDGGTFNALGDNGGAAVFNYGIAEINGGKFTGYTILNNQTEGVMTINNADITERTSVYGIQNNGGEMIINGINLTQGIANYSGSLTINAGKIHTMREGSSHAIYMGGGELTVNDGDFMGNGNEVINANGNVANIYGGTFTKDPNGKTSYLLAGSKMTIYGGTFNAHASNPAGHPVRHDVTVMGGTFNYNPQGQNIIPEGYLSLANDNGTWTVRLGMAKVNKTAYTTFQEAIDAVKDGETVTLLSDCNEDVTFTQTPDKSFELDGAEYTMTGTIKIIPRAGTDGNVTLAIKNFNFVTSEETKDFINASETNYYPRNLTVSDCTFEGPGANSSVVAVRIKMGSTFTMENCSATNLHSLFQNGRGGWNYTIKNCTLTNASEGISLNSVQTALVESVNVSNNGYGLRINAAYATTTTVKNCTISSFIPVVVREASANHNLVFEGTNTMTASNTDNLWCAIGTDAYTTNGTMPSAATGKVTVDLKDENLSAAGIYGAYWPPVAKVGNTEYGTIDEAIAAWTNNTTLTLMAHVTLSDVVTLKSTEHHILDLSTFTMTAAEGKNAFVIKACGTGDSERTAITIKADGSNPGGINAGKKSVIYYKYADGGIEGNDRPIIKIEGGVFTGSTSSIGTTGIHTIGSEARKCATLNISGGVFNCSIYGSSKSKLLISGGIFHYSVGSQGDSTALRLISGGTFKTLGFMTADSNNTKFWFGTSMANSNVGLYINDDNYLVVGGPVITEFGDKFAAKATNPTKWSSYLAYSSVATNGLYYTNAEMAIAKHGEANVVLK